MVVLKTEKIAILQVEEVGLPIYINGKKSWIINLTDHENLPVYFKNENKISLLNLSKIQTRVDFEKKKLVHYDVFGTEKDILKFKLNGKIIAKNDSKIIKIVSTPVINFLKKMQRKSIYTILKEGWLSPYLSRKINLYPFEII